MINTLRNALSFSSADGGGSQSCNFNCNVDNGRRNDCKPPALPAGYRRGTLPTIVPLCDDDEVTQFGTTQKMQIPEYIFWDLVARAASYSPRTPLSASGVKAGGTLSMDTILAAAAPATAQGNKYLFPGLMLEIGCNDQVAPGVSDITITGTFEDGQPLSQSFQVSTGHVGLSRFLVMFNRTSQGQAYPSLVVVERDYQLTLPAVATPLTAAAAPNDATSWVPTNGLREAQRDFNVSVTAANTNTTYRYELFLPVGWFWDWMEAQYAASLVNP